MESIKATGSTAASLSGGSNSNKIDVGGRIKTTGITAFNKLDMFSGGGADRVSTTPSTANDPLGMAGPTS